MTLLFGDEAIRPIAKAKPLPSALISAMVHVAGIIVLLWISLTPAILTLPERLHSIVLVAPPPLGPPPPAAPARASAPASARPSQVTPVRYRVPSRNLPLLPPASETLLAEAPPELAEGAAFNGVPGGVPGGIAGGVPGGVPGGVLGKWTPPPVQPAPAVVEPKIQAAAPVEQRIQVSGELQEAMLLVMVKPVYPSIAKEARIQGAVRLSAVIDKEGKVVEVKVLKGHPMLVQAALEVIKKWRYRPTLRAGQPVEVATDITVNFHLMGSGG